MDLKSESFVSSVIWFSFLMIGFVMVDSDVTSNENEHTKNTKQNKTNLSRKDLYMYGFNVKRAEQIKEVKRIRKITDYSKRYKMVKIFLEKMFKMLTEEKLKVTQMGYIPGDEFPENQDDLDSLGHVLENVALFGDLILRCPDVTHKLYDNNKEWKIAMNWGIMFSNETGIFQGANMDLLNLAAQELEIIPRDENYINPYKEATIKAQEKEKRDKQEKEKERKEEKKRKKKKRKRKGPRLGGGSGEL